MSFSGKKPFGWHGNNDGNHASEGPRSTLRSSQTFSAQSRRFFGFAPLSEEKVLISLKARLENPKPMSLAPKMRKQSKRLLPSVGSSSPSGSSFHAERRSNTCSPSASVLKSRQSPTRSFSCNHDFSPYSSPTRVSSNATSIQSHKPCKFVEYLGGVPDLVQLKSHSDLLDDGTLPGIFPDLHRLLTSNTSCRDGLSDSRNRVNGSSALNHDFSESRSSRRIRFDDNVQRIFSDYRPPSSSNCTDLSTVYIIEDVDSSESSEDDDAENDFDYDPDKERLVLALRLGVLPDHPDFLWIVDECILESSKDPWQLCFNKKSVMFHNRRTGEV